MSALLGALLVGTVVQLSHGGLIVHFIPVWVADVWRVVVWSAMVLMLGRYARVLPVAWRTWRKSAIYGSAALAVFMVDNMVETISHVHHRLHLEFTPVLTVAVILSWLSLRELERTIHHRDRRQGERRQGAPDPRAIREERRVTERRAGRDRRNAGTAVVH